MDPYQDIPDYIPKEQVFFITFGVQYRTQTHPEGDWITPDGFVVVVAKDEWAARKKANETFGHDGWAFIYDHLDLGGRFNPDTYYPAGVIGVYYADKEPP